MNENIIEVKNVSMRFNLSREKIYSIKEYIIKTLRRELQFDEFWALKGINIKIIKGEIFGIVGLNGAGKSTLLKIVAGILKPTTGQVIVNGTIAPLIELGAGFDMDLTAYENIFLNGAVLGFDKKTMSKKVDEIIEFSELENFINVPLKNFSSGMIARLGFSIATIIEPDILIVDEILSVGDFKFQEKSQMKIKKMIENGVTVIFVSHSIEQVKDLCDRVVWINKGEVKMIDKAEKVCKSFSSNI